MCDALSTKNLVGLAQYGRGVQDFFWAFKIL